MFAFSFNKFVPLNKEYDGAFIKFDEQLPSFNNQLLRNVKPFLYTFLETLRLHTAKRPFCTFANAYFSMVLSREL